MCPSMSEHPEKKKPGGGQTALMAVMSVLGFFALLAFGFVFFVVMLCAHH